MSQFEVYNKKVLLNDHNLDELQTIYDEHIIILDYISKLFDMESIDREIRLTFDEDDKTLWDNRLILKGNYYIIKKALFEKKYGEIILN